VLLVVIGFGWWLFALLLLLLGLIGWGVVILLLCYLVGFIGWYVLVWDMLMGC
jgi:hypothetical protein